MITEELREEKLYEAKQEMYAEIATENKMREDSEYATEVILDNHYQEIEKAIRLLNEVSKALYEYGVEMTPVQILEEI